MSVTVPPERHIPIQFGDIYSVVKGSLSITQRHNFEAVRLLIQSLNGIEFMTLRQNLKNNFLAFSLGAKQQTMLTRIGRSLPPKTDLDSREQLLVGDFVQLMASARFHILTRKEWETALSEDFLFHLPVAVNWDFFDDKLFTEFWSSSNERQCVRALLPQMSDRVLIFHRGISMAEDSGLYISKKVDLLVDYLVLAPLMLVWSWIIAVFMRLRGKAGASDTGGGERSTPVRTSAPAKVTTEDVKKNSQGGKREETEEGGLRYGARVVHRKNLRRMLPNVWSVLINFPRTLKIEEPSFKEVVMMYRAAPSGRNCKKGRTKTELAHRSKDDRLRDILAKRNIHIRMFHDIPMADIEAIFPDKKIYLKTLSLVTMVVQLAATLGGAIGTIVSTGGSLDMKTVFSALSLMGAQFGRLWSSMQSEKSELMQEMTNILYDKTNDAQEGVLSMLLEDMADQHLKEAVIAYIQLFMNDEEVPEETLDARCEAFLQTNFGLQLDFSVEDTLPRLVEWELVTTKTTGTQILYRAVGVEEALIILQRRWGLAYQSLGQPPTTKLLPLRTLLADPARMKDVHVLPEPKVQTLKRAPGILQFRFPPGGPEPSVTITTGKAAKKRKWFQFWKSKETEVSVVQM